MGFAAFREVTRIVMIAAIALPSAAGADWLLGVLRWNNSVSHFVVATLAAVAASAITYRLLPPAPRRPT